MISEIYSVAVTVSDRKKAVEWYRDKLGFIVKEDAEWHWTVVGPKDCPSGTHLCEMESLEPGNTGIVLRTHDFNGTVRQLKQRGVEFTQEPKTEPWGTCAMFKDPDGNEFWLMPGWKPVLANA